MSNPLTTMQRKKKKLNKLCMSGIPNPDDFPPSTCQGHRFSVCSGRVNSTSTPQGVPIPETSGQISSRARARNHTNPNIFLPLSEQGTSWQSKTKEWRKVIQNPSRIERSSFSFVGSWGRLYYAWSKDVCS